MAHHGTLEVIGTSNTRYTYNIYDLMNFKNTFPCNYVYIGDRNSYNDYPLYYIGQTNDINRRMQEHLNSTEKSDLCIQKLIQSKHITYIATLTNPNEQSRINQETDLRKAYTTLCNQQ